MHAGTRRNQGGSIENRTDEREKLRRRVGIHKREVNEETRGGDRKNLASGVLHIALNLTDCKKADRNASTCSA
jgi:hypothetical protein